MDEYNGKRASGGVGVARRGSSLSFRDPSNVDRNIQICSRLGCSTRLNSMKSIQVSNPEKAKFHRPSFHSPGSKSLAGSSSTSSSVSSAHKKSHREQLNTASLKETVFALGSDSQGKEEVSESIPTIGQIQTRHSESEDTDSAVHSLSMNSTEEGRISFISKSRPRKQVQRSGSGIQGTSFGSSVRHSFSSKSTNQAAKSTSQGQATDSQRYGRRNPGCASISDVLPSGCSSSETGRRRKADETKKKCLPDGEGSSARVKNMSRSNAGNLGSPRNAFSNPSPSFPEHAVSQQIARRSRNWLAGSSSVSSVRTRRTPGGDARTQMAEHGCDNSLSSPEPVMIPQLPQTEFSFSESTAASSSRSFPAELSSNSQSSYGQPGSSSETARSRPIAGPVDSSSQPFYGLLVDRDGFRRFNMEGIAEVLLALERIEQDEELTYEQLLVLETNLLLGGISFHDQHRDMRLDIDNMSYEELLALEEKMGTVSTALTEEALSKCLKRSCYASAPLAPGISCDDDTKCSICQEEYVMGDEVGNLGCDHRYHVLCIHQWLQQKNWCPICKAPASPS